MDYPLVSVIIPTHNRPELLMRAVKSALNQTYQNTEIIVVDDVGNINVDELKSVSDKIQYIKISETYWISENRNAGIHYAKGKYIAGLDDDDIWFSDYLETLITVMESDESIGLACSNGYQINDLNEKPIRQLFPHLQKEMRGNLFAKTIWDCFMQPSLMIIRKNMFDIVGFYRNIRGEDLDIIMKISAFTNIYYTPKPCGVWYRRLDNSSASESMQSTLEGRLSILLPALQCLTEIQVKAIIYGRHFSLYEKLVIYLQSYYFTCFIIAVHFMFKSELRYKTLLHGIKEYPILFPITLMTPLCSIKSVRDFGQDLKKKVI
jgi:glycosyltransferase involved in cell wall biosynthesis